MNRDFFLSVSTDATQQRVDIAPLANGGFVAVWDDIGQDPGIEGGFGVYSRTFSLERPLSAEIPAARDRDGDQIDPEVFGLKDGGYVVAWESDGPDRTGGDGDPYLDIHLQRFAADGTRVGDQLQITPTRKSDHQLQDVVAGPDGDFRVVYAESNVGTNWDVYTQTFDAKAKRVEGETKIENDVFTHLATGFGTETPGNQLAHLKGGGYVAAYCEAPEDENNEQVYLQRYDSDGDKVGGRQLVSKPVGSEYNNYPEIAALDDGGHAIAWTNRDDDNLQDRDVYVRAYGKDGDARSGVVRVNTDLKNEQELGDVVALPGGGFLVTYISWDSQGDVSDLYAVRGRVFDAGGKAVSGVFDISERTYADMAGLSTVRLKDGSIVATWEGDAQGDDVLGTILAQGTGKDDVIDAVVPTVHHGRGGDDRITGTSFDDTLKGDSGADTLAGGRGGDQAEGGKGGDVFRFAALSDSAEKNRDVILDFGGGDRLDLSAIDANAGKRGDQAFRIDEGGAFEVGEVRIVEDGRDLVVRLNVDGDKAAESEFLLKDLASLSGADFIL